jgi:hypothetical protein
VKWSLAHKILSTLGWFPSKMMEIHFLEWLKNQEKLDRFLRKLVWINLNI